MKILRLIRGEDVAVLLAMCEHLHLFVSQKTRVSIKVIKPFLLTLFPIYKTLVGCVFHYSSMIHSLMTIVKLFPTWIIIHANVSCLIHASRNLDRYDWKKKVRNDTQTWVNDMGVDDKTNWVNVVCAWNNLTTFCVGGS